jgi:predicted MPP superfamily phosphohydrolase
MMPEKAGDDRSRPFRKDTSGMPVHLFDLGQVAKPKRAAKNIVTGRRLSAGRTLLRIVALLVLLAAVVTVYAFKIEPGLLSVRRITLTFPNLPVQWDGRKIVFFADIHAGRGFSPEQLDRVVTAIVSEKPDLVLFGGDIVDSETPGDDAYSQRIGSILAKIDAPFGKFAIAGNHDNRLIAELKHARRMLEKGGFTLLINSAKETDGIVIGGLDESYFGQPDPIATFKSFPEKQFRVVLMHQPDYLPKQNDFQSDLILSGHSHNGQITFFGLPLFTVHEGSDYPNGYYRLDERRQLFVSSGLGTVGIHARLFVPPQIVVMTMSRKTA